MTARDILDAMGVIHQSEAWIYRFFVDAKAYEVKIFDGNTLGAPSDGTKKFVALIERDGVTDRDKYWDIALETEEPRDVMAFCLAAQNSIQFGILGEPVPEDQLFEWEGMAMHNAFAEEDYGDWTGDHRLDWPHNDDGRAIVVPDPATRDWGKPYVEWRDAYAEKLVAPKASAAP